MDHLKKQSILRTLHRKFVVEVRLVSKDTRRRLYVTSLLLITGGCILFLLLLLQVVTHTGLAHLDQSVEQWMDSHRFGSVTPLMISLAVIFGPVVLPILIGIVIVFWIITSRHIWRPLVLAGFMAVGVLLVQIIARTVDRPRPPIGLMLMGPDHTFSFPSGHVMGTADFLLLTSYLIVSRQPTKKKAIIYSVIAGIVIFSQIVSRMYLGYHWLTDTLASLLLSTVVLGALIALDTWRSVRVPGEKIEGSLSKPQTEGT